MKISRKKVGLVVVVVLLVGLLAGRIYLPYWLKNYVNEQIALLEGYGGSVKDVDVHLWRGAYQLHDLNIYKTRGGLKMPFVAASTVDLSVEWGALFHGAVVAEIDVRDADLNFSRGQTGQGAGWTKLVDALSPLDINRFEVHSGKVSYIDYSSEPNVNIYISDINARITNLRDIEEQGNALPSQINVSGSSIGKGVLDIKGHMNILKNVPDFDLDMKLENANLTAFNDYARARAAIDFEKGHISIFSELAAANGHVTGYIKPVATDISLVDVGTHDKNPINAVWESLVSVFMELFENQTEDQFALRIPVEGDIDNPDRDAWSAFMSIFQNAFGKAFPKDTDGNINFMDAVRNSD